MTEEARQRLQELRKERRGDLARNALTIASCTSTVVMAIVLWFVTSNLERNTDTYVQAAQNTVKDLCVVAEKNEPLPADSKKDCDAAKRNELPQALQSVVDNPDPNDPERQDSEYQDPENQDPEVQDSETQDPEIQDPENQDPESDEMENQEDEVQDEEIQESEIQEPEEQNAPVCPPGYSQQPFHYFGPDGVDNTGDEEDWLLCKKVV